MFVFAMMVLSPEKMLSQNPIPSFNVPIIIDPTLFEEVVPSFGAKANFLHNQWLSPSNRAEKKLCLNVKDRNTSYTSWVVAEVYSLDGSIIYGLFTVNEGTVFEIFLSASLTWGVRVIDASANAELDVWFD